MPSWLHSHGQNDRTATPHRNRRDHSNSPGPDLSLVANSATIASALDAQNLRSVSVGAHGDVGFPSDGGHRPRPRCTSTTQMERNLQQPVPVRPRRLGLNGAVAALEYAARRSASATGFGRVKRPSISTDTAKLQSPGTPTQRPSASPRTPAHSPVALRFAFQHTPKPSLSDQNLDIVTSGPSLQEEILAELVSQKEFRVTPSPTPASSSGHTCASNESYHSSSTSGENQNSVQDVDPAFHLGGGTGEVEHEQFYQRGRETSSPAPVDSSRSTPASEPRRSDKSLQPSSWATVDQLQNKLLLLAVSGDDPSFVRHFLLTYRRFMTPRDLLLAMQRRMRWLDQPSPDPLLARFGQLRICRLLQTWIIDFPCDFAARGASSALAALSRSIMAKPHLLHYVSDVLSFLEIVNDLVDQETAWAYHSADLPEVDDDDVSSVLSCEETDEASASASLKTRTARRDSEETLQTLQTRTTVRFVDSARPRSLPLSAKTLIIPEVDWSSPRFGQEPSLPLKAVMKELKLAAQCLNVMSPQDVAEEITRIWAKLFLEIEPRHWLRHVYVSGKKDPETDTIARLNQVSNHLADWVVSVILVHDKAKSRARQIEKFVDIGVRLRQLNNYMALRAIVAGINNATYEDDIAMEFVRRSGAHYKSLQSYNILFQQIRSHRAYRMALKNTTGACIPALEVHLSDLIRTHEGNPDTNGDEPGLIHWGKFHLMGRFVYTIVQYQEECRRGGGYDFPERPLIRDLLCKETLMDENMQRSRVSPSEE